MELRGSAATVAEDNHCCARAECLSFYCIPQHDVLASKARLVDLLEFGLDKVVQ
jgi:hypothetical protein